MFFFYLLQFIDIILPTCDLCLQKLIPLIYFFELMILIVKMISQNSDQLRVSKIIKIIDKLIVDFNVKETSLLIHMIIQNKYKSMLLEWGLILSVTSVSVTMLMIVGTFIAIMKQSMEFYQVSRNAIVLLISIFNIGYIVITPFIFNLFNKHYVKGIIISTVATGVAAVGRYLAEDSYTMCLIMTSIVAVAHIPIITAPYGLLKLFPDWQKGYAASIPLFLPVLGINFCILYGMEYIADDGSGRTKQETRAQIIGLNGIIAIVGILSCTTTIILTLIMQKKIERDESKQAVQVNQSQFKLHQEPSVSTQTENIDREQNISPSSSQTKGDFRERICDDICELTTAVFSHKRTAILIISWGIIIGVNWTYGSLFYIIFEDLDLTGKQIAMIGLAANLSSAVFSNLGTFIKNRFGLENIYIIYWLNIFGILAAIVIQLSRVFSGLQNLYFLIFVIIVLRAGFSSFVSLAFIEMEKGGVKSLVVSGFFFWIANVSNLITMEMMDFMNPDVALTLFILFVVGCVISVKNSEKYNREI